MFLFLIHIIIDYGIKIIFVLLFFFSVNCWPNETGSGCDVNIEYGLEQPQLELNDVIINIPLP
jgi:hypothetical protein